MGELFFLLKSLILTAVVVVILQVRVGEHTLEEKAIFWAQASSVIAPIQQAADGGLKVFRKIWRNTIGQINSKFLKTMNEDNIPGKRSLGIELKRSANYMREQAKKAEEFSKPHINKVKEFSEEAARKAAHELDEKLDSSN